MNTWENCQVVGFDCLKEDLCPTCKGTGQHPNPEMCCACDDCFDEVIGWSTGIKQGSRGQEAARAFCSMKKGRLVGD